VKAPRGSGGRRPARGRREGKWWCEAKGALGRGGSGGPRQKEKLSAVALRESVARELRREELAGPSGASYLLEEAKAAFGGEREGERIISATSTTFASLLGRIAHGEVTIRVLFACVRTPNVWPEKGSRNINITTEAEAPPSFPSRHKTHKSIPITKHT
jgi:hypothetical protein